MLEIRFSINKQKDQTILPSQALYIMNKEPLLVCGDKDRVSTLFQAIRQGENISFWQDQKQIDTQLVKKRILCIQDTITLPVQKRIADYLSQWLMEEEISAFLASLPFDCDPQAKLKECSPFELHILQLKIKLFMEPKLILLTYDASILSQEQLQIMRELLLTYIEKGCYILLSEQAKNLLPSSSVDIANLPTTYVENYLEESIDFTIPCKRLPKRKYRLSLDFQRISSILCRVVYLLCSFCFIYLLVISFSIFQPYIDTYDAAMHAMDEESAYPVFLGKVLKKDDAYQSYEMIPYTPEETKLFEEYAKTQPLYPQYAGSIDPSKVYEMTLEVDGMIYPPSITSEEGKYMSFTLASYHEDTKQYLFDKEEIVPDENTIYISKFVTDRLFPDVDVDGATIHMTISVPIYSFHFGNAITSQGNPIYDRLSKYYEVTAPVKVVTMNYTSGEMILPDDVFQSAYKLYDRSLPYDPNTFFDDSASHETVMSGKTSQLMDTFEDVQPYQPNQYLYIANAKSPIERTQKEFKEVRNTSGYISLYDQAQESKDMSIEAQDHLRSFTQPMIIIGFFVLLVASCILNFLKQRKHPIKDKELSLKKRAVRYTSVVVGGVLLMLGILYLLHQEAVAMSIMQCINAILQPAQDAQIDTSYYYEFIGYVQLILLQTSIHAVSIRMSVLGVMFCAALYYLPECIVRRIRHRF